MSIRITIACPENLIAEANQFALCVGNTPADAKTFGSATWEDGQGERFALASLLAGPHFPQVAADVVAASIAQAALQIWSPLSSESFPSLSADLLVAVIGLDAALAIPLLGLSPVPTED